MLITGSTLDLIDPRLIKEGDIGKGYGVPDRIRKKPGYEEWIKTLKDKSLLFPSVKMLETLLGTIVKGNKKLAEVVYRGRKKAWRKGRERYR